MKILLATDGTKYSDAAVEMISKFNISSESELRILTVIDLAVPLTFNQDGSLPSTIQIENAAKENAKIILEETKNRIQQFFPQLKIVTEILVGSPDSRIVETAEKSKADLIVVGSHGYNRWERLLLGSVSDSVIHHAPCSVLVVRG